jgi:cell shape-determining protein MreD
MFLLLLPIRTPRALQVFLAFLLGLLIDVFYNTPGLHAAASTFTAYMRDAILRIIEPRGGYTSDKTPNRRLFGDQWFWQYAAVLLFVHLVAYSFLEEFAFSVSFVFIERLLLSYIFSLIIVILPQYILPAKR